MDKGNLFIVEDNAETRLVIEHIFKKHYIIEMASSGVEALDKINNGYRPHVILSDQRMPYMTGSEFLEQSINIVPDAIRVILTAHTQTTEIIQALNQSKAYMFLTKPFNNLELVQAVKNCFQAYHSNIERNQLTEELKKHNEKLIKVIKDFQEITNSVIPTLLKLTTTYEKGYFTNHTQAVVDISLSLMDMSDTRANHINRIVFATIMLHMIISNMPEKYIGIDPNTLENFEQKDYFIYFNKTIDGLLEFSHLRRYVLLASQIWEHYDGTGAPVGIDKNNLKIETQIISLASMYHDLVYLIPKEQLLSREELHEFEQTPDHTMRRHSEAIQYIFKNSSWFEPDLASRFKDLIRSKKCASLVPENCIYKIIYIGDDVRTVKIDQKDIKTYKKDKFLVPVERFLKSEKKHEKQPESLQTKMSVSELRSGMISNSDIVTKFGRQIVKKGALLTIDDIDEVKRLLADGLISGEVDVLVPQEVTSEVVSD